MRSYFRVTVIEHKTDKFVGEFKVIATDQSQALLKAELPADVRANPDRYEFVYESFQLRAKKETQKVEVVSTE